ncbi:MAG TPA: alpha/beta hydrolase family protein [Aggregatilinea sp.]|uniref:alpha/beta hydrolase family protein n=1 Tax=Aggregatilinea sp. TaxID=2806333 RepID=UPI002B648B38|nr:alpha/beta hydrolase family protein [Aggregatilinea sp.]HML22790.1 alpha/beta hydrolase family protein [Aggregatilinea sp.]
MNDESNYAAQSEAREKWNNARRRAFYERLSSTLGFAKRPAGLLSFEEVQDKLRLTQSNYRGLHQVPLDQIVGSVGRYNDFTRTFLPLIEDDSWRWRRVAEMQFSEGLPPIELYKVGDAYFVKDGNHRVSVARQFGATSIEAYVWEYETPVGGIRPETNVDELIVKAEYRAFLDRTRLDVTRPEQEIILTEPDTYPALETEIELYRRNLERIDGEKRSFEHAAAAWYDMVYTLAVDVIRESGVLDLFPGRTEADLYVWVSRNRRELSERYGHNVSLRDAVSQLVETQQRPGTMERMVQSVGRSVAGLMHSLRPVPEREPEPAPQLPVTENDPLGKLLAQVQAFNPELRYAGQRGDEWRWWRGEVRGKLWELLGASYIPAKQVDVEVLDRALISGVERSRIVLVAADGLRLPGYLMRPADLKKPAPALLVYPGHGTIQQTAGLEYSLQRANALAFAQAGYITLTIEERGFGELSRADHVALDNIARLVGRTWLGMTIEDGLRALDYLQTRDDVLPDHLGVTGLGLGGGLALYTAALDERARACVIENYLGGDIDLLHVLGHGCDFVPNLRRFVQFSDVARAVAPRPALFVYPRGRDTTRMAREAWDAARPTYETFGIPDRTRFMEHDKGDRYVRTVAKNWFDRWLAEEPDTSVLLWAPREDVLPRQAAGSD